MKFLIALLLLVIISITSYQYLLRNQPNVLVELQNSTIDKVEVFKPMVIKKPIYKKGYGQLKSDVASQRTVLAQLHKNHPDSALGLAKRYLNDKISDAFFGHWYGTIWDFNGITETPNEGYIACGYLVSTILKHADFKVNRYKLAQQGAANIIKSLSDSDNRTWLSQGGYKAAIDWMLTKEDGLFVVGLDYHVGFAEKKNGEVYFIHSSYIAPGCTVKEVAKESPVFKASEAYVVGQLFQSDVLLKKWLTNETISVVTN